MTRSRTIRARAATTLLAIAVALSACGGDGDDAVDSGDPPSAADDQSSGDAGASDDVPMTIPAAYLPAIRPVEIDGDALPALGGASIESDPAVGMRAPIVRGEDANGNAVTIDAATDGPTMVVLVAHWCPHCNAEIPRLVELRDEGRLPQDLNLVAIATSSEPTRPNFPPDEWLDDLDWSWPVVVDDVDLAAQTWVSPDAYGLDGFPFVVLIDGDGNVAARWSGESEKDEMLARIEEHLGLTSS